MNQGSERSMADKKRVLEREEIEPGSVADGDAPLANSPPNVTEAEPAPDPRDAETEEDSAEEAARIETDLDSLQRDLSSASDRYLRLAAEFDNYRKRVERERGESYGRAQAELASRLLDVLDDLERVAHHAEDADTPLLQGVQMVERKLRQSLESAGLEPVAADGARFDPNSMEAVAMVAAESGDEDDMVSDVFQRGYYFKGMLIRPARVRVKKHGA
jgi:molecular chaperone GrpE